LAAFVLNEFVQSGRVARWQRHFRASGGAAGRSGVADVYEVHLATGTSQEEQAALRSLLEAHGRTSLAHGLQIRFHPPSGTEA
jgi:hypothetical protein